LQDIVAILLDPSALAAFAALVAMEIALGVDNVVMLALLADTAAPPRRALARRVGLALALLLRLGLLAALFGATTLTTPLATIAGRPISLRDATLFAGGVFLLYKATAEIHARVAAASHPEAGPRPSQRLSAVIAQIVMLDLVFSVDSIITAIGMTDRIGVMVAAIVAAVGLMLIAADELARFIRANPTIAMLAFAFLLMIGAALIADATGFHIPRGYIYAAMAFSAFVEALNVAARPRAGP